MPLIVASTSHLQVPQVFPSLVETPPRQEATLDVPPSAVSESIPNYLVNISITSVEEAWEVWEKGLVNGPDAMRSPPVQYLGLSFSIGVFF